MEKSGFSKFAWIASCVSGLAAILFLLAPVLQIKIEHADETTEKYLVNMIDLLNPASSKPWILIVAITIVALAILSIGASFLVDKFLKNEKLKNGFIAGSAFLYALALAYLFGYKEVYSYFAYDLIEDFKKASIAWGLAASMGLTALGGAFALSSADYLAEAGIRGIAEDGVFVALAFVFSYIKLPVQAGGGSINFQMLPLMIIALRRGPIHGFVAGGLVYGALTCLTDGYGFATYPFDYLIGFGSVAVMGFFRSLILSPKQTGYNAKGEVFLITAGVLATLFRMVGSCVSSMVIYGLDFVGALEYNGIYVSVSGALAIGALAALYGPLAKINSLFPTKKEGAKVAE